MFEYSNLSPTDFELLIRDVIQDSEGITLESFGPGKDLGVDFRFASDSAVTIVQAKHYQRSGYSALKKTCVAEAEKVKLLSPERYILVTSVSLTVQKKEQLLEIFADVNLVTGDIWGLEDIENRLSDSPEVVRKHFKLWLSSTAVLEQILKSGLYERSASELEQIAKLIPKYVEHGGIAESEQILDESGALIISGAPGIGKTTLARILIWLHVQQGWQIRVIDSIEQAFGAVSKGVKQLLFFDDFLGQVRVTEDLIRGTDLRFPPFLEKVKNTKDLRFVLTTRDYILSQARKHSQRIDETSGSGTNIVLDVGYYTRTVKAQILFNHIYFSDLEGTQIESLLADDFYLKIIDHKNFNPRVIEQITKSAYLDSSDVDIRSLVQSVLDKPELLWEKPYRNHFSESAQLLMLAMTLSSDRTAIPAIQNLFVKLCGEFGSSVPAHQWVSQFNSSLKELEGATIYISHSVARFINPGVRDYMNDVVVKDGLVPVLTKVVPSYSHLGRLWNLVKGVEFQEPQFWELAARRLCEQQSESSLSDLYTVLELCLKFDTSISLQKTITLLVDQLVNSHEETIDVSVCEEIFESIEALSIPSIEVKQLADGVSKHISNSLYRYGYEMSVEEAVTLFSTVACHPMASEEVYEAAKEAADAVLSEVKHRVDDIQSREELEALQDAAMSLASEAKFSWHNYSSVFDERYWLLNEYEVDPNDHYSSSGSSSTSSSSDEASIRSMFSVLKLN